MPGEGTDSRSFPKGSEPARSHVARAFQRGIDPNDAATLGYHGTRVRSLLHAIRTGHLPAKSGAAEASGGPSCRGRT